MEYVRSPILRAAAIIFSKVAEAACTELKSWITKEEMMEAVHVGAAIKSGATLVHGVMMMNKVNKLEM